MTNWKELRHIVYLFFRYGLWDWLRDLRRKIWNKRIKLCWHRSFIRKNEFHPSLDLDPEAMMAMNHEELERYLEDITRRRQIAHEKDLAEEGG